MAKKYEHLIIPDIQWVESLPDHEGSIGGKGFPVLMNGDLVKEANAWVCPTMFSITERQEQIVASGKAPHANKHIHDGDEMYLILGEKDKIEYKITLGDDEYLLKSPCCVYIPAGLPHAIEPTKYTAGVYGGSCQIYLDKEYITKPVPENPMKLEYTQHLIVPDIQWVESLPDHEGSIGGKGFPVLMNGDLVEEANAWVCPTMFSITKRQADIVSGGNAPHANPHTHDGDEMYLILGEKDKIEYKITLGEDDYILKSPCCVYIPAGLPHAIMPTKYTEGTYGGSCQIYLDKNYTTKPV